MQRFPTFESCDQDDPREAFQWAFARLPFSGSTPLIVQPEVLPEWSQLMWDYGFRHHPELQTKKPVAPFRGQQHTLNPAVTVADVDADDPVAVVPDPAQFTRHEQEVLAERLRFAGVITEPEPEVRGAKIMPTFNPSDHTPSVVHGYLLAADDDERRRVLALEMRGKQRDKILNRPEWRGL